MTSDKPAQAARTQPQRTRIDQNAKRPPAALDICPAHGREAAVAGTTAPSRAESQDRPSRPVRRDAHLTHGPATQQRHAQRVVRRAVGQPRPPCAQSERQLRAHLAECRCTKIEWILAELCGIVVKGRRKSRYGSRCRRSRGRGYGGRHEHHAERQSRPSAAPEPPFHHRQPTRGARRQATTASPSQRRSGWPWQPASPMQRASCKRRPACRTGSRGSCRRRGICSAAGSAGTGASA